MHEEEVFFQLKYDLGFALLYNCLKSLVKFLEAGSLDFFSWSCLEVLISSCKAKQFSGLQKNASFVVLQSLKWY